jgi:hypothetical protein
MNRIGTKPSECYVSFSLKEGHDVWQGTEAGEAKIREEKEVSAIMSGFFYLQDSNFPQIFTDMNLESYKFKEYDNKNIVVSFPKKFKNFTWEDGTGNDSNTLLEGPNSDNITIQICEANISKLTRNKMLTGNLSLLTVFFEIHTKEKAKIVSFFGKGASVPSSLSTTNSEGDRRSPEEFGKGHTERVASSLLTLKVALLPEEFDKGLPGTEASSLVTYELAESERKLEKFDGKNSKTLYKNDKELLLLTSGCISNWSNMDKSTMDPNLGSFVCPNHKIMRISHKIPDMEGSEDNTFISEQKYQPKNTYQEFTKDFMNELIYSPKQSTYAVFEELLVDYPKYDLFLLSNLFQTPNSSGDIVAYRVSSEEATRSVCPLPQAPLPLKPPQNSKTLVDLHQPKFVQRFTFGQFLKPDSCEWIMNEIEIIAKQSDGWKKSDFGHYPTSIIELDTKVSLFRYIITQFKTILNNMIESYSLHKDTNIDVTKVFISKYNSDAQCCIEPGKDGSSITIQIMLSDVTGFVGGGIQFDDHLVVKLKQGDMLLYNGDCKHSELPITHGMKYSIILFTNVFVPM